MPGVRVFRDPLAAPKNKGVTNSARGSAEIESPEFPGERLIACYNPLLAEKRRRKREQLLAATEEILAKLARAVSLRTKKPLSSAEIGVKAGRVIERHKMAKHIRLTIHDGIFT